MTLIQAAFAFGKAIAISVQRSENAIREHADACDGALTAQREYIAKLEALLRVEKECAQIATTALGDLVGNVEDLAVRRRALEAIARVRGT